METLRTTIEARLRKEPPNWVFTRKDLREIAPSGPLGVILSRLAEDGRIRRIGRGLYDTPRLGKLLKAPLPPNLE